MSDVELRLVGEESWQVWRDTRLRALRDSPSAFCSTYDREAGFTEADWRRRIGGETPAVLAFDEGETVGMAAGYIDAPDRMQVVAMWVDPGWRGQGVGRQLLDEVVGWATEREMSCQLDVTLGNDAARRMYERYGFVGTGRTEPLREGSPHLIERMTLRDMSSR